MGLLPDRFWDRVHFNLDTGCWEWTAAKTSAGYSQLRFEGRVRYGHRLAYEALVGPIPDGLHLDHFACEVRRCVNPWHVRPVTPRENQLRSDGIGSQMLAKRECHNGHPLEGDNLYVAPGRGDRQCRICTKAAHCRAVAAMDARRAAEPSGAPHGTNSTYVSWKCRCQLCRAAHAAYARELAARRAAV